MNRKPLCRRSSYNPLHCSWIMRYLVSPKRCQIARAACCRQRWATRLIAHLSAIICVRPQGSNMEGTSTMSAAP